MIRKLTSSALLIMLPVLLAAQSQQSSCRQSKPTGATADASHGSQPGSRSDAPANAREAESAVTVPTPKNKKMSNSSADGNARMAPGTWGGPHIRIQVDEDGAHIEYDCANGTISAPLTVDAEGRFDLKGTFTRRGPGPIRINLKPKSVPAKYKGRIEGKQMTLAASLENDSQEIGTFTLTHGSQGRLWKCY